MLIKKLVRIINMVKKNISSLELAALVEELQVLKDGKISQVYQPEKNLLLLQNYARGAGKKNLRIIPGKYLNFTDKKETTLKPSSFSLQLRKYLNNAFIREIYQHDSERIIILVVEKAIGEEKTLMKFNLVIELFSKGNLLITNQEWKIIGSLANQRWESRIVKVKEVYKFPPAGFNWKKASLKQLKEIVKRSDKKNLATCLATEISLGGTYAEELCIVNGIDPKKIPSEVSEKEVKQIHQSIKDFLEQIKRSSGFIYEDGEISPFKLKNRTVTEKFSSYNEALDTLNPFEKVSPYEKKIISAKRIISEQKQALLDIEKKIELNTAKGNLIYENYAKIQKLQEVVSEMKKEKSWQEIKKDLESQKKIKQVDLKQKRVVLDL